MKNLNNRKWLTCLYVIRTQGFIWVLLIRKRLCSKFPITTIQVPWPSTWNVTICLLIVDWYIECNHLLIYYRLTIILLWPNSLVLPVVLDPPNLRTLRLQKDCLFTRGCLVSRSYLYKATTTFSILMGPPIYIYIYSNCEQQQNNSYRYCLHVLKRMSFLCT